MITLSILGIFIGIYSIYRSYKFITNINDETPFPIIWFLMMGAGISLLLIVFYLIDLGLKYLP